MSLLVRKLGRIIRIVGVSNPEDLQPKVKAEDDPPSWRDAAESADEATAKAQQ